MTMTFQPNAYGAFVSVLGKDSNTQQSITRDQLLGGLAYYLTELPDNYIQAFVNITLCSPALWTSSPRVSPSEKIHPAAWGVMQATQQAVMAKHAALLVDPSMSSILPPLGRQRVSMAFKEWTGMLISGSQPRTGFRDCSIPRLAFLSGVVLGLRELGNKEVQIPQDMFSRACGELVVSVAECLDQYAASISTEAWDIRHALRVRAVETHLDTVVQLCALSLPLVSDKQLEVLDLSKLACVCLGTILHVFQNGHCFDSLESELFVSEPGLLEFKAESKLPQTLKSTHSSSTYIRLGSIAKLAGHIFVCMAQSKFWLSRIYPILNTYVEGFGQASLSLERSWARSALCKIDKDENIAVDARPTTTIIWHILKVFLFTTVFVVQSLLDVTIYYHSTTTQEGKVLARSILTTFCRLSFVSLKFGALAAEGGGFNEMKRAFFGALDVLASNSDDQDSTGDRSSIQLVNSLASELSDIESTTGTDHPIYQSRVVYFMVCAEHVMNQLPGETIEKVVLPIVQKHLNDSDNREKYEAAHSVMLAIFATAEVGPTVTQKISPFGKAYMLIPAYIEILLKNSAENRLSTDQFRLAFQALVRSASLRDEELGWLCVEELSTAIGNISSLQRGSSSRDSTEQLSRLQLALISSMSALPISKLPRLFKLVRGLLDQSNPSDGKLVKAVYHEIMEHLGDREKDFALRWWLQTQGDIVDTLESPLQ
ncbi:Mon1 domain protein [Ceratobasidium sp. AG-Ba]|nr:Mon1 domain protein [Ceratobasidium sp. AG-Ba]